MTLYFYKPNWNKITQLVLIKPTGTWYWSYKSLPKNQHTALMYLLWSIWFIRKYIIERIRPVSATNGRRGSYTPAKLIFVQFSQRLEEWINNELRIIYSFFIKRVETYGTRDSAGTNGEHTDIWVLICLLDFVWAVKSRVNLETY